MCLLLTAKSGIFCSVILLKLCLAKEQHTLKRHSKHLVVLNSDSVFIYIMYVKLFLKYKRFR